MRVTVSLGERRTHGCRMDIILSPAPASIRAWLPGAHLLSFHLPEWRLLLSAELQAGLRSACKLACRVTHGLVGSCKLRSNHRELSCLTMLKRLQWTPAEPGCLLHIPAWGAPFGGHLVDKNRGYKFAQGQSGHSVKCSRPVLAEGLHA